MIQLLKKKPDHERVKASAQGVRPAQLYDSTEDLVNRLNDKMRFKLRRIK